MNDNKVCPMMSTMIRIECYESYESLLLEAPCIGSRCALWVEKYEICKCKNDQGKALLLKCSDHFGGIDVGYCGLRRDK